MESGPEWVRNYITKEKMVRISICNQEYIDMYA